MSVWRAVVLTACLAGGTTPTWADVTVEGPAVAFRGASTTITLSDDALTGGEARTITLAAPGADGPWEETVTLTGGAPTDVTLPAGTSLELRVNGTAIDVGTAVWPGGLTLVPPALAIITALVTRQVIVSLLAGVFVGALLLARFAPWEAFTATVQTYAVGALAGDGDHVTILIIAAILGGMSGVLTRSGGATAVAAALASRARDARGGQLATWLMGLVVFFDDYANTLIVGNMMRSLSDRLKVSREKLSFLVDATAAPVASIAPISTWIGFEVGLIQAALVDIGSDANGYEIFLRSIPYRFYPIFMLGLGIMLVLSRRDFGPMYAAEVRARSGGGVLRPGSEPMAGIEHGFAGAGVDADDDADDAPAGPGVQAGAWLAFLPIVVVIATTFLGILLTGRASLAEDERTLRAMFGNGDSYSALLWAGALGSITAIVLSVGSRALRLGTAVAAWVDGIRAMTVAMIILTLAWAIGAVCGDLGTADVLVGALGDRFPAGLLPAAVFILSAVVSFSTGTSWGTMAILVPLVVPLSHAVSAGSETALVGAVSGVLAGSVFGDHCSPISDTTVLSSLASGADHIDHVRTQLPYALVAGGIALVAGDVATAYGLSVWVALPLGLALVFAVVRFAGRRVPEVKLGARASE